MRITAGEEWVLGPSTTTTTQEEYRWKNWRCGLRYFAVLCVLFGFALGCVVGPAFGQQPICRPGPAGSIICEYPATPGATPSTPSYVTILSEPASPPQLGPNQNALTYRAALRDYCLRNLRGCGPGR